MNVQNVRNKRRQIIIITVHTHTIQNKANNKQTIYSNKLYSTGDKIHQFADSKLIKTPQYTHKIR